MGKAKKNSGSWDIISLVAAFSGNLKKKFNKCFSLLNVCGDVNSWARVTHKSHGHNHGHNHDDPTV